MYAGKTATDAGRACPGRLLDLLRVHEGLPSMSGLTERVVGVASSGGVGGVDVHDGVGSAAPGVSALVSGRRTTSGT